MLLELPQYNKGTAFSLEERLRLGLIGLLPFKEESLDTQVDRAYRAFQGKSSAMEQNIYLRQLQNLNQLLYFRLIIEHAAEMLPVIYTPTVGEVCRNFSEIYRKPQGLFLNYPEREHIDKILDNVPNDIVEVIVITDGEAILGIGDQGVGGMGIPIGKLSLYSALGGIDPATTLPVVLDVGTNNQELLHDPIYVGWKHERLQDEEYDEFVDTALMAIHRKWPNAVIQFEDFGTANSQRLLDRYIDRLCCFNDDIQGTAAVTLGCLIAACRAAEISFSESNIVITGAGAAGTGIAAGLLFNMMQSGLDYESARQRIFMIKREGLIHSESKNVRDNQRPFMREQSDLYHWQGGYGLLDVVRNVKPTVLIGVSGQSGMFTKAVVTEMAAHTERPCIFPLSNPTSKAEAYPEDLIEWTNGRAIVATGSPFEPVTHNGTSYEIAQCNNAYAFPGIGLGLLAIQAKRVTNEMFDAVANVIGHAEANVHTPGQSLLPPLSSIRSLSREIAISVADMAIRQGLNGVEVDEEIEALVDRKLWQPHYPTL